MLMSIIKLAAISCFLMSRKYWNSRIFDCRTCRPISNRKIAPFPVTDTYQPELNKFRHKSNERYIFSPRPKF